MTDASLDAGGQMLLLGNRERLVWVAHPEARDVPAVRVRLTAGSFATSGQSERSPHTSRA